jgi:hypothetical protein
VPIDAGNPVADNRNASDYQRLKELSILNECFLLAIVVEEKTGFFFTAAFSHNTPCSNSIEER